ncbi:TPA: phage tail protein I, partial [Stenotrophomonas maltophilia]
MNEPSTRLINARLRGAIDGRNRTFRHPGGALASLQAVYRTDARGRQPLQGSVIEGSRVTLATAPAPGEVIDGDAQVVVPSAANLLPTNATHAERALARAIVARPLPVDITALWDADRCPTALLPWLAWALSVDEWKAYWPEAVKRARVRTA